MDQVFLLCSNLFRRPGQCSFSLLLTLAFPAQSVIAQRGPTAGTGIFQTHIFFDSLSDDRKTPCDTLPLGQADAGARKGRTEPRPVSQGSVSDDILLSFPSVWTWVLISIHLLSTYRTCSFYPLHLVHQSPDLKSTISSATSGNRNGMVSGMAFVYHHHAEGQIAKQPGINTVHREAKDGKQLPIKII